jgi:hypothetical protein
VDCWIPREGHEATFSELELLITVPDAIGLYYA